MMMSSTFSLVHLAQARHSSGFHYAGFHSRENDSKIIKKPKKVEILIITIAMRNRRSSTSCGEVSS